MLLSSISSSVMSSSVIAMTTTPSLPQYGIAMVSALIVILSLKEILSSSQKWNEYLNNSFNLVVVPFIFTFVMIVGYKVFTIV
jgi:hypothetical protein